MSNPITGYDVREPAADHCLHWRHGRSAQGTSEQWTVASGATFPIASQVSVPATTLPLSPIPLPPRRSSG